MKRYRIVPAWFARFALEERRLFIWTRVSVGDNYEELAERARLCGELIPAHLSIKGNKE